MAFSRQAVKINNLSTLNPPEFSAFGRGSSLWNKTMARIKEIQSDPFSTRIREIVLDFVDNHSGHEFRSAIVSEVQSYSQLLEDEQEVSQLFFKICDLLLDCESKSIPDKSFKVLIANLIHECSYSEAPSDSEIQELTGMSALELSQAGEALIKQECLFPVSRKSQIMNWSKKARKKNASQLEELEEKESA